MKRKGAGRLQNRVVVKCIDENKQRDAGGQLDLSDESNWRILARRWCQIVPSSSREFVLGDQVRESATHQIRFRYDQESKKFKTTHKVVETVGSDTTVYNFAGPAIDEDGAKRFLIFPATEVPTV